MRTTFPGAVIPDVVATFSLQRGAVQIGIGAEQPQSVGEGRLTFFADGEWVATAADGQLLVGLSRRVLVLDNEYDGIVPGSLLAIERSTPKTFTVESVRTTTKSAYNIASTVTEVVLDEPDEVMSSVQPSLNERRRIRARLMLSAGSR